MPSFKSSPHMTFLVTLKICAHYPRMPYLWVYLLTKTHGYLQINICTVTQAQRPKTWVSWPVREGSLCCWMPHFGAFWGGWYHCPPSTAWKYCVVFLSTRRPWCALSKKAMSVLPRAQVSMQLGMSSALTRQNHACVRCRLNTPPKKDRQNELPKPQT